MRIDLNCDLGEGCPHDAELLLLITSASIACGFHAGDPAAADAVLRAGGPLGVRLGAHPSFPDRENFGRREMVRSDRQVFQDCVWQIGALAGLAKAAGVALSHVKPHGALYNMACRDDACAAPVVEAAVLFGLPVLGLPGSRLEAACAGRCEFVAEGFADRRYLPDGSLVPRTRPDAFVENTDEAVRQAEWLIRNRGVRTLCVHGDNPHALAFVRALRGALEARGTAVRPFA